MKLLNIAIMAVSAVFLSACACNDDPAARALAQRIIPEQAYKFRFEIIEDTVDCFELESVGDKIVVRGNNSNSLAVGLNHYLRNYCLTTVSWYLSEPVEMPAILPAVDKKVHVTARTEERFFLNYCTFGYTMPWWKWEDWERFIDWMALNGVTMPLAITGQEAVWQKVWRKHGLTDEQIRTYFTGPAHLPWHRMSNLDYWEGPLPQAWIDGQAELQKQIVTRERELCMTPVLPAFAGHVPQELKVIHPEAEITRVSYWGGFADEYRCSYLAPMDPLYALIQRDFMEEQIRMFGTDHIYGVDPFNEIDAPSWDPETLAKMSELTFKSMMDVDPEAIWLQMGWLFYADPAHWNQENIKAYLSAVPQGRMIILDYYCELTQIWKNTQKFYGQPYIWCYLGNFGGNTMITGNFNTVSERIEETFTNSEGNLYGLGSTLEGFGVNQCLYEFILDKAWVTGQSDEEWVNNLADRRVGAKDAVARDAWRAMMDEIYVEYSRVGQSTLTCAHPCLEGNWHWTTKPAYGYTYDQIWNIWRIFLQTNSERDTYKFDVVNVGRQFLGDYFLEVRNEFSKAYKKRNVETMKQCAAKMLEIMDDMDRLVACHSAFSFKNWVDAARTFGMTDAEKDYYEKNARTLISVWGDSYSLSDYASRSWAGFISSFYKARWEMFLNEVIDCVQKGRKFDQKAYDARCWDFECAWTEPSHKVIYPEAGDPVAVAREIFEKYSSEMESK